MSHVVGIAIEIKDPACLEAAAEKACELVAVRTTEYDWWGAWLDDYHGPNAAYKMGFDPKAYGTCEFALVQADSPLGKAELAARAEGRRLTHEEATTIREQAYGASWRTSTSKPYSIGVVKDATKPGVYKLAYDTMDSRLVQKIGGQSADKLRQQYAVAVVKKQALKDRCQITETVLPSGEISIKLHATRRG